MIISALVFVGTAQLAGPIALEQVDAGSSYQDISYEFIAKLDTDFQVLDVAVDIVYVNRSPSVIDTIYLNTSEYMDVEHVILDHDIEIHLDSEGILSVPLNQSLEHDDSCTFTISYQIEIPIHNGVFGYVPGHYEMTRWYPRICVFDDLGWHRQSCDQQGKQYSPFASYSVKIVLPDEFITAATGTQVDPMENFFIEEYIATGQKIRYGGEKTIHFIASHAKDFVWVCDPYFIVREHTIKDKKIRFFYRPYDIQTWENAVIYCSDIVTRYEDWFGYLPFDRLSIVQGICKRGTTYPQVVFVNSSEDLLTRLFEANIAADIGAQWFSGILGVNEIEETWFSEGLVTYASMRYLEDKYGKDYSLIKSTFIPAISLRYFHRANYYVMRTNMLEKPVSTSSNEYDEVAFAYMNSISSKPALFFSSLQNYFGEDIFSCMLQDFISQYTFQTTRARDLFDGFKNGLGEATDGLYHSFVNTTDYCDWRIKRVSAYSATIDNNGKLPLPVEVFIETDSGTHAYQITPPENTHTIRVPENTGEIISIAIDPTESLLDINYWNNYHPRRIKIRPITSFEFPSFSTYCLYWLPYPWYDSYDGVTANFYWFGDRFADFDFIRGGHQFMGGINYGFSSQRAYVSLNYQTPVIFTKGTRIRVALNGSHNKSRDEFSIGLLSGLGQPLTSSPATTIENRLIFNKVYSYASLDSIDWSLGRNIALINRLRYKYAGWDMAVESALALRIAGSDYEYLSTMCAVQRTFDFVIPCRARIFAGKIFGDAPLQEQLYLCGDLHINWFADLLFSQAGSMSPQEHIHVPGGGNMRGYQTFHIKSDQMYALNLEFPVTSFIRVFTDVGYYNEFAFDAGISLAISAETVSSLPLSGFGISANFPLYTYTDQPWKLRWSIGFSM